VDVFRHIYAGQSWYVFHDRVSNRYYRINGDGAKVLAALDGVRSIEEIVRPHIGIDGAEDISADEISAFIGQLTALDLVDVGAPPIMSSVDERREAERASKSWTSAFSNPLFLRIPLFDPYPLIVWLYPWVSWIFGRWGIILCTLLMTTGGMIGLMHWHALTDNITDRLFSAENLALSWCLYPIIKIIHELAHGLALHRTGGQVHRTGLMFIAFMPIPYVDASESIILERKSDRMLVAGAGILAEILLGSLALIGWANAEPGLFRSMCSTIVIISGFSTVLFNGNPLQRYDGYYIFSDLIEVPGLGTRSTLYLSYLTRRYLLREYDAPPILLTSYERWWLTLYGPASFIYRIGLMVSIAMYVAETYPVIGGLLGAWTVWSVIRPLALGLRNSIKRRAKGERLSGAITIGTIVLALGTFFFLLPVPFGVVAQGVTDVPKDSIVRPMTSGIVAEFLVQEGTKVVAGQPLLRLTAPYTLSQFKRQKARVAEMQATYARDFARDQVKGAIAEQKLHQAQHALQSKQRDVNELIVRSPAAGQVMFNNGGDILGSYVGKGEIIARIWKADRSVIRTFINMSDISLIRSQLHAVTVRPGYDPLSPEPANILLIQPQPNDVLPSPVLSLEGGGPFAVTRDANNQLRLSSPVFQIKVALQNPPKVAFLGGRSFIRFNLGTEPLGLQILRKIRLTFLRRLNV